MMTALINEAVYDMENYMSGQALPAFSATISAMTSSVGDQCGKLNCTVGCSLAHTQPCLTGGNYSLLPPSERQKYSYDNCVEDVGDAHSDCTAVKKWNATAPTPCQGYDGTYGICDPINQHCYAVQDIYTARKTYRQIVQTFITSDLINNFHALDRWALGVVNNNWPAPCSTVSRAPTRSTCTPRARSPTSPCSSS